jgi:glycosyltransferase involved in cell wall biosynthesis/GR25 family glycosyltransferase involved in LPS biosynthesis
MTSQPLLRRANEAFNSSNFAAAARLYQRFQETSPELAHVVEWNLRKSLARLAVTPLHESPNSSETFELPFDRVYLVNLQKHAANRLKAAKHFSRFKLTYTLWNAVDGYVGEPLRKYKEYMARELGTLRRYPEFNEAEKARGKGFIESAGAVGYIFTYTAILQEALAANLQSILILEDDVLLSPDFHRRLTNFVAGLPDDWKVLQLGASQYDWTSVDLAEASRLGWYLPRRLHTCGSFAIAIARPVFAELRDAALAFEAPFDHLPLGEIYERHRGKCFVCYPNLVMPDVTASSIRGSRDQFQHGTKMRWHVGDFDFPLDRPSVAVLVASKKNVSYVHSFSPEFSKAVDFRLYFDSSDGLRPLHNQTAFDPAPPVRGRESILRLPEADYHLTVDPDVILTEDDVIQYVEHALGVRSAYFGALKPLGNVAPLRCSARRATVVIPTYKRPEHLERAALSAIDQDYEDVEVIIVNDNGVSSAFSVETRKVVDRLRAIRPQANLTYIEHQQNRNGAAARNTGLFASSGEYVMFLDDDDEYLPGRISRCVAALQAATKDIGAVYCGYLGWNSPTNDENRYPEGNLQEHLLKLDYKRHYLHTNTTTYRRSVLLSLNGFDETFRRHQDLELNTRFFQRHKVAAVRQALARLKPRSTDVDNRLFDVDFLRLKEQFLNTFKTTIDRLDKKVAQTIYLTHWSEVLRYVRDRDLVLAELKSDVENGRLQVALELMGKTAKDTVVTG